METDAYKFRLCGRTALRLLIEESIKSFHSVGLYSKALNYCQVIDKFNLIISRLKKWYSSSK